MLHEATARNPRKTCVATRKFDQFRTEYNEERLTKCWDRGRLYRYMSLQRESIRHVCQTNAAIQTIGRSGWSAKGGRPIGKSGTPG